MSARTDLNTNAGLEKQFTALTQERETFEEEKRAAEADYERAIERLNNLKSEQVELTSKIRASQEVLGDLSRKHTMLQQSNIRLTQAIENEREDHENIVDYTKALQDKENADIKAFCGEMAKINDEMARTLLAKRKARLKSLLSIATVDDKFVRQVPRAKRPAIVAALGKLKTHDAASKRERLRNKRLLALLTECEKKRTQELNPMDLFYGRPNGHDD